jgi:hypothetical protein
MVQVQALVGQLSDAQAVPMDSWCRSSALSGPGEVLVGAEPYSGLDLNVISNSESPQSSHTGRRPPKVVVHSGDEPSSVQVQAPMGQISGTQAIPMESGIRKPALCAPGDRMLVLSPVQVSMAVKNPRVLSPRTPVDGPSTQQFTGRLCPAMFMYRAHRRFLGILGFGVLP